MKVTKELIKKISNPRPAPKNHKYVIRGWGWKSDEERNYAIYGCNGWVYTKNLKAIGHPELYYLEIVRIHKEDETPLVCKSTNKQHTNMKKLYIVTKTSSTVVYAESEDDAINELRFEDLGSDQQEEANELLIHEGSPILPNGWSIEDHPWGDSEYRTIKELIATN